MGPKNVLGTYYKAKRMYYRLWGPLGILEKSRLCLRPVVYHKGRSVLTFERKTPLKSQNFRKPDFHKNLIFDISDK